MSSQRFSSTSSQSCSKLSSTQPQPLARHTGWPYFFLFTERFACFHAFDLARGLELVEFRLPAALVDVLGVLGGRAGDGRPERRPDGQQQSNANRHGERTGTTATARTGQPDTQAAGASRNSVTFRPWTGGV